MISSKKTLDLSNPTKTLQIHLSKPVLDSYWLVGFFEGDGCFSISEVPGPQNKKAHTCLEQKLEKPVCRFILTQSDPAVLWKIQKFVGSGSVYKQTNGAWTYRVSDKMGLIQITKMLNGKLVLQKRLLKFQQWVGALNCQFGLSMIACTQPAVVGLQNAWLCGFADADGSFNIQITGKRPRLRLRFYLDQSQSFDCLQTLQACLGGTLHCKIKNNVNHHRLIIDSFDKCAMLIEYFCQFPPLTTSLLVRFIRYARVYRWYVLKQWKLRKLDIAHLIALNKRLMKVKRIQSP